ncbi:MAG: phenylalanine--tRNA ligase subunit beta [Nitrospirae bacterium]|nr:phenylalanine--tRNA ligase subunit beta [Nitrospirota bacterium]
MRVPFEWLREFVDISASPEEVAERLTMVGFEVEAMESVKDDTVFEVNVTPNRPDCLSILGIAREVSVAFRVPLKIHVCEIKGELPLSDFSVEIFNHELCSRYAGRVIKDVRISDSPEWIKTRLEKCGIRAINSVVDITNYVLLEFGHPLHAFDADTINGKKIKVGMPDTVLLQTPNSKLQTKIKTLDGVEREILGDSLLIWDAENPIAVAGVMGGLETEVNDSTANVFLESAYFEPFSIRRTSKRLNLISESSYRFERGADIEFLEKALNRAALMIREIAGGTIYEIIDVYPVRYVPEPIKIRYDRINRILGTEISNADMLKILKKLGITTEDKGDFFIVYPSAYRRDIKRDSDVAEEIARSYGYDRIPSRIPRSPLSSGKLDKKMMNIIRIREAMRKSGFTEVINYSFMSPSSLDVIAVPQADRRRNVIVINNPLRQDESLLRTTLIPALIGNFKYNLDRGIRDIRFFEISSVFEDIGRPLPLEELRLGGIFYRDKTPSLWKEDVEGFFITKGAIESMFEELKINEYSFSSSSELFLHKGQASDIYVRGAYAGYLGVLGPEIVERLDLKKQRPEIVVFELNLDLLLTLIPDSIKYNEIPRYPYVERDIAIIVDESLSASEIKEIIRTFPSELIEEVSVFDSYRGSNIPEGKKSLAFNIRYRAKDRTLTDDEVEELHASLVEHILEKTGGELRR